MEVFPHLCVHCKCIGHLRDACPRLSSSNSNFINITNGNDTASKGNLTNVAIPSPALALHGNVSAVNDAIVGLSVRLWLFWGVLLRRMWSLFCLLMINLFLLVWKLGSLITLNWFLSWGTIRRL
ncbi:hypothetical protein IEQ34_000676 [Dendrobium chrysotoxum]|uniref:Uncharacterized protein n=1 Tax=Dendrobium chrysotoxum TaxID=161865 RepID=A0AAV7HSX3_DENCH|nr:hypothetical protein IEQ34_000676 [Dendrobium chrysotoxum]